VLEAIIHPRINTARKAFLARNRRRGARLVVLDIPLLLETEPRPAVDMIVVVSAPRAVQRARLKRRRRMTPPEAAAIVARQMPDREKRRRADRVIETGLSRRYSQAAIRRLIQEIRG
jgi:dephospho-CoA kinase